MTAQDNISPDQFPVPRGALKRAKQRVRDAEAQRGRSGRNKVIARQQAEGQDRAEENAKLSAERVQEGTGPLHGTGPEGPSWPPVKPPAKKRVRQPPVAREISGGGIESNRRRH